MNQNKLHLLIFNILDYDYDISLIKSRLPIDEKSCENLVKIASRNLVLPSLYYGIKKKKIENYFKPELLSYLHEISQINEKRNNEILTQISSIAKNFNENKIKYVFIKGAAFLAGNYYKNHERMIGDIDILIYKNHLDKASKALYNTGYRNLSENKKSEKDVFDHRHLPRLVHKNYIASVELHKFTLDKKYQYLISNDEIFSNSVFLQNSLPIPSKYNMFKLIIYNSMINDYGRYYNFVSFKCMVDLLRLNFLHNIKINKEDKYVKHFMSIVSLFHNEVQKHSNFFVSLYSLQVRFYLFRKFIFYFARVQILFEISLRKIQEHYGKKSIISLSSLVSLPKKVFHFFNKR